MARTKLSQYIAEDLRRRLSAPDAAEIELKLDVLSQDYSCSTRPVRTALKSLTDEGVLLKEANGRFRLLRKPRSRSAANGVHLEQAVDSYPRIAHYMVQKGLVSFDEFVREQETAERFSISRAQMRQFFQRLSVEGILEHVPRRGWKVRVFSQKDLQDFLAVREALEITALETAWGRMDRVVIEGFLNRNVAGRTPQLSRIDNGLHQYWIELSDNRYIKGFFKQQAPYFSILFTWEDNEREAVSAAIHSHREILTSILAGNKAAAIKALSEHILSSHPVISKLAASKESVG